MADPIQAATNDGGDKIIARGMTRKEYGKWHREQNLECHKQRSRDYYQANKARVLPRTRNAGRQRTQEKRREYWQRCYAKPSNRATAKLWRAKNKERVNSSARQSQAAIRATPRGCVDNRMSSAIYQAISKKKAGRKWETLVGYTLSELCGHLESKFTEGMSWEAFMRGEIHIDHKIPKSLFNYETPEDLAFKQCWALENLQPMWASQNLSKWNKILQPTQIALGV